MADIRGLIVTHGELGSGLLHVAELVLGPIEGLDVLSNRGHSATELRAAIRECLESAAAAEVGLLILIDDYGGSCSTAAQLACGEGSDVVILAGVNLAMLLGFLSWRDSLELEDLAQRVLEKGREAITRVGGA